MPPPKKDEPGYAEYAGNTHCAIKVNLSTIQLSRITPSLPMNTYVFERQPYRTAVVPVVEGGRS